MSGPFLAKRNAQSGFVSRARQTEPDSEPKTRRLREAAEIVALCQQIEGMPWLEELPIKDDDSFRQHASHKVTTGIQKHAPPGNAQLTRIKPNTFVNTAACVND